MNRMWFIPFVLTLIHVAHSARYQNIGSCYYFDGSFADCNLTLICVSSAAYHNIFTDDSKTICANQHLYAEYEDGYRKPWIGTINFQDCERPVIPSNIFELYSNVHTYNMSDLGLTSLQMNSCQHAKNLLKFNASMNKIIELGKNQLGDCKFLIEADFSFNRISKIDPDFFPVENQLELLNLRFNNISELAVHSFQHLVELKQLLLSNNQIIQIPTFLLHTMKNLIEIDFSYSKIAKINAFTFSGDFELEILNLSHNQLVSLEWKFFKNGNLKHLEQLDLSSNSIGEIKSGTFSSMINLRVLNLAQNKLKSLNANILPPRAKHLKTLTIAQNQMQELIGFTNYRIPNAKIMGMSEFNCSYFNTVFQSLTWKHVDVVSKLIECNTVNEGTDFNDYSDVTEFDEDEIDDGKAKKQYSTVKEHNESGSGLLVSTWINAICLIIIVLVLVWVVFHKQLPKKNFFTSVLYRRGDHESLNVIENNGYDVIDKRAYEI
ncbi:podocan-like [Sitodiplosis mosellana]|uniref:podocan-like n=1 Tax=Sitodiplosis mosellana TaxID=263140 RepID=UPI0024449C92|nr:podocan-like [Sitodiplosis mosellana]